MIPFQISSNSAYMHKYLVDNFGFQEYCSRFREKFFKSENARIMPLSTKDASSWTDFFQAVLSGIMDFLSTEFLFKLGLVPLFSPEFNRYCDETFEAFFGILLLHFIYS